MKYSFIILIALVAMSSCGGRGASARTASSGPETENRSASSAEQQRPAIKQYTYKVVQTYPHSTSSYTQGLFWHEGYLYEGTGQYGASRLMKTDLQTGKALQEVSLGRSYFGEGIAWHKGRIYQITWMQGKAFVYDGATFRQMGVFNYRGEGWGITSDGEKLYMSDGTHRITVRNPENFAAERIIEVTMGRNRRDYLNELEWIGGEIWANVFTTSQVVRIDPRTGYVTGVIDFTGIQAEADRDRDIDSVFNGIAYDPDTGNIYVTGKNWNKVYQVEIIEK